MCGRIVIVFIVITLVVGCSVQKHSNSNVDGMMEARFEHLYLAWRSESEALFPSSYSATYTQLPQFKAMIDLGEPAVPYLEKKLRANKGMDFMLADAIIAIMHWKSADFSESNRTLRRVEVLNRLAEK